MPTQKIVKKVANSAQLSHFKTMLSEKVMLPNENELKRYIPTAWNKLLLLQDQIMQQECEEEIEVQSWFYAKIYEAAEQRESGFDPFRFAKFNSLTGDATSQYITELSFKLLDFSDADEIEETLKNVVELSLWGTRSDALEFFPKAQLNAVQRNATALCNNPESDMKITPKLRRKSFTNVLKTNRRLIQNESHAPEVDVLSKVVSFLLDLQSRDAEFRAVHIVPSEVGHGLIADLLLGHVLLNLGIADRVHYHSMPYSSGSPYAVTSTDISGHIEHLADPTKGGDIWNVRHFGEALRCHVVSGNFVSENEDYFWADLTAPLYAIPSSLRQCFEKSALTIIKGDLLFQRMLGDIDWKSAGVSIPDALSYWYGPLCVLRTIGDRGAVATNDL